MGKHPQGICFAPTNRIYPLVVDCTSTGKSEARDLALAFAQWMEPFCTGRYTSLAKVSDIDLSYANYSRIPKMFAMKDDFVSKGRSVSDMKAHLVLTSKHHRKVFNAQMLQRLAEIVEDLCQKWDCKLIEFNGEEDHVHLLFQYFPQMELTKFINNFKTVTSRRLRNEFQERINQFYSKGVLWNSSYFIASFGGVTISALRKYIESQDSLDE